jgi:hypothetical protein
MNDSILGFVALMSLSLGAVACVTRVEVPSESGGTSTGAGGAGGASATGGGDPTPCVPQPDDPDAGFTPATCADLAVMKVSDPVVIDDSGDGKVSPGEGAVIHVNLSEIAGKGFSYYPGVTFTSDLAMVPDPGAGQLYAILACQVDDLAAHIVVPSSVAKGTVVHVKAQVSMLGATCTSGDSVTLSIKVE